MLRKLRNLFKPEARPSPTSPDDLFRRAQDLQSARAACRGGQIAAADYRVASRSLEALNELAAITLQNGELKTAVELYGVVIAQAALRGALLQKGNASNRRDDWKSLWPILIERSLSIPLMLAPGANRGAVLERLGRPADALDSYDRAIAQDPLDFLTHYNRGSALRELKRFDEALASYDRGIELKPVRCGTYQPRQCARGAPAA